MRGRLGGGRWSKRLLRYIGEWREVGKNCLEHRSRVHVGIQDRVGECVGAGKRKLQRYSYSDHVPMMVSHAESHTVQLRTKSSVIMLRHLFAVAKEQVWTHGM